MLTYAVPTITINREVEITYPINIATASDLAPGCPEAVIYWVELHHRFDHADYDSLDTCMMTDALVEVAEEESARTYQALSNHIRHRHPDWQYPDMREATRIFTIGVDFAMRKLISNELQFKDGTRIPQLDNVLVKHLFGMCRMKNGDYGLTACSLIHLQTPSGESQDAFRIVHHSGEITTYA